MINLVKSKDLYLLFGLYFISNALLLLNFDGLYWDDWNAYNQDNITLKLFFEQIQHGMKGDFFLFLSQYGNGIYPFRLFVFFGTFIMGIFVYLILSTIKEIDKQSLFFITLLFLVIPVNSAKMLISITPFLFPVLIFYAAFYLLSIYIKHPNVFFRMLILILFFLSFSTNSLLVFYFSIFLYLYYVQFHFSYDQILVNINTLFKRYWDFWILPFLYFGYKSIYLKPYGLYEGYNSLSIATFPKTILILLRSLNNSIIQVITDSLSSIAVILVPLLILIYYIVKRSQLFESNKRSILFLGVGIVLFLLAIFPYAMVGKSPDMSSIDSRYQLLTPLGLGFIVYFGLLSLKKWWNVSNTILVSLLWLLIFAFIGKNITYQYEAYIDYCYSTSIQQNLKENVLIQNHSTFIINNGIQDSLLYKRTMPFYEYNGIFKKTFKCDTKLGIKYAEYAKNFEKIQYFKDHKQYNFSTWQNSPPLLVTFSYNYEYRFRERDLLKLLYISITNHQKFLDKAKELTTISVEPLPIKRII